MSWPRHADGSVDWVKVFEDPDIGLIPLIERSDASEKLISCVDVVVRSLFVREADSHVRDRYLDALNDLVDRHDEMFSGGDEDLLLLKTNVVSLLRSIKNDRIERARALARDDTAGADTPTADERRRETEWAIRALDEWMNDDGD